MSTHSNSEHKRYRELDSLRGFAALSVFFSHVVLANRITGSVYQKISMSPLHMFFDGTSAVLFFFVLSGFVLALPYIHNENRPVSLLSFYFKRLFRIYPAFAIAILASLTMKHFLYHPGNMQPYTTWLSDIWNWDIRSNRKQVLNTFSVILYDYNTNLIDPVIWSLLVEVKVSLLLPFLIIIIRRNNFVFNGLLLVILLYLGLDFYIGTFYIGVVMAKYVPKAGAYIKRMNFAITLLALSVAIILYTAHDSLQMNIDGNRSGLYASVAGSCMFILLALHSQRIKTALNRKPFTFLCDISYSYYLIHLPIFITCASLMHYTTNYSLIAVVASSLIVALSASFIIYKLVELPMQRYAQRTVKKFPFFDRIQFS